MQSIHPEDLQAWSHDGQELALLDVREQGQYGEGHLFYAVCAPYSRLELDIARLVPRRSVRMVLVDDGDGDVVRLAARHLTTLGYTAVAALEGGMKAWAASGLPIFAGVNVPSKTFGELVEVAYGTPHVTVDDLVRMKADGGDLVVLDGRPFAEYQKMSIPGATCCPNGELAVRFDALVPNPNTRVVINCAGRTRSIIGAQTLISLGVPNPVFALQNGTQGWHLADQPLAQGATRRYSDASAVNPARRERARQMADRAGVQEVERDTLDAWRRDPTRTTFVFDVRTREEFERGTVAGAVHTPGGQLIQATDQYVGVRGARLVLVDDDGVRGRVTASWLRQMGHDAAVLLNAQCNEPAGSTAPLPLPSLAAISPHDLATQLDDNLVRAVDLRRSIDFRQGHVRGAQWSIRSRLAAQVADEARRLVFIADDGDVARLAALELSPEQRDRALLLQGGFAGWRDAGLPQETSPNDPPDRECIDFLFFVHDRHEGNKESARQYLAWEQGLVARLHPDDRAAYHLPD
jgi:rhodanese-related sulfurtransferase